MRLPTGTLLVANKAKAELFVFHLPTRTPVATLPTGVGPHEIAMSDDGALAVVSNYGEQTRGNTLTVVDIDRGEIVAAVPTQQPASHMVVLAPDRRRAYTTNIVAGTVSELDLDAGTHLRTIDVAPMAEAIAITRDGKALWVGSNAAHTISIVDLEAGRVSDTIEASGTPIRVELSPSQTIAVASAAEGGGLHVFDVASRRETTSIDLRGSAPGESPVPIGIAFATDTIAFVSLARAGEVAVIDLSRAEITDHLDAGDHPDGIAFAAK